MTSVRRALLLTLLLAITGAVLAGAVATYRITRYEIDAVLDYQLRLVALAVRDQSFGFSRAAPGTPEDLELVIQVFAPTRELVFASTRAPDLPGPPSAPGYADVTTASGRWRTFALAVGSQALQVAQAEGVRSRLALAAVARTVAPLLLLAPVLALLVFYLVGRALRPVGRLADQIAHRSAVALEPFPLEGAPAEVQPLVRSLNGLVERLSAALASQRAFVADAAHELRTPLAALKLQAQLAARVHEPAERAEALGALQAGLDRAAHVVQQLLTLARQEPGAEAPRGEGPVALAELVAQAVADHARLAEARGIDLGAAAADPAAVVRGDPAALRTLLANLVDNALRYTPAGGSVDVAAGVGAAGPFLEVADTGPGIPPEDRERVFDRFYRRAGTGQEGSGLGLAIVKAVAERHGARVALGEAPRSGLLVRVVFPRPERAPGP